MTIATVSADKTFSTTNGSQVSNDVVACKHTLLAPPTSPHSFTQVSNETLDMLARQLEYYFSTVNLSRDTYLQTLRNLNDGYVPASILSNFAKIQLLCPFDSYNAILKAATDHSETLEVVNIDKETSKTVLCAGPNTLLAIGPKDHNPIQLSDSSLTAHNSLTNVKSSNNDDSPDTILFRDVPEDAVEDDLRKLFLECEIRPSIKEIVKDVSNYWFVTLTKTSREEMVGIMFVLRSKTLRGEPVKARLKSANTMLHSQVYTGDRNLSYEPPKKSKKSNRRSNRKNNNNNAKAKSAQAPPPPLVESQYPSLEVSTKRFVSHSKTAFKSNAHDDHEKRMSASSDGASTATSSTASSLVGDKPTLFGGYAAALLREPSIVPNRTFLNSKADNGKHDSKNSYGGKLTTGVPKEVDTEKEKSNVIETGAKAPWGGGRSFADILKQGDAIRRESVSS